MKTKNHECVFNRQSRCTECIREKNESKPQHTMTPIRRLCSVSEELLGILMQNLSAWEGEEESVQFEHAELIVQTKKAIERAEAK